MIEEVKDLIEDVKEKVGNKGFTFIAIALVGIGAYLLLKNSNTTTYYEPTGVTGYPDVGANADEVMASVNSTLEGTINDFSSVMDSRLEYLEGVLADMDLSATKNTEEIIQNSNQNTTSIIQNSNQNTSNIIQNSNQNTSSIIQNSNENKEEIKEVVHEVKEDISTVVKTAVENTENKTQVVVSSTPKATTPVKTPEPEQETYTYTTKSGLNTNTSIVDALKATGADSSFAARAEIYYANGGKGTYTGSYEQNVQMLNKMKSGNLVKA